MAIFHYKEEVENEDLSLEEIASIGAYLLSILIPEIENIN